MEEPSLICRNRSNSSPLETLSRSVCHVCCKQFSQYTCPRCNTRYCSLPCYKSHSSRCNESFMRDNVLNELKLAQPNEETKLKTLEMLKRVYSEEAESDITEDDDFCLSDETAKKVLSGIDVRFDDLTVEEKKEFQRAVASGKLSKLIEPWEPWWLKPSAKNINLSREGTQLVQPISEQEPGGTINEIPSGPADPLHPVRSLASTDPSPLLGIHLVDILYSYCFVLRIYNGDWQSDPEGSAMAMLSMSSVIGESAQPETVMEALSYNLEQTCSPVFKHMGGLQFGLTTVDDVVSLLALGGPALVCALCDLQKLVRAGNAQLKSEKRRRARRSEVRNKLKQAERKVYFVMCWVHEQPREAWTSMAARVETEKVSFASCNGSKEFVSRKDGRPKIVIQEIE